MENIEVKIKRRPKEINPSQIYIGKDGENLQDYIVFSFEDEFVDGQARLEIEFSDGTKYKITEIQKVNETYVLPIKSELTKYSGVNGIKSELVITEGTNENEIPIYKSLPLTLIVSDSINAVDDPPERYTEWIDSANAKLNQIDEKIEEVDTAVEQVNNAVERVDEGLSDLTRANEEAREIVSNFESNVESYTNDFNTNAENKTSSFNSNYESKLSSFNSNASEKTTNFNDNADSKLSSYNSNASSKLSEYNTNATNKLNAYNENATTKLGDYNTNATTKLGEYNTNASNKLEEYNQNASDKINEYDEHVAEMQEKIDNLEERVEDLEDNQITLPAEGTNIHVEDAAKARLYEFKLGKESSQYTTTGKNLISLLNRERTVNVGVTASNTKDNSFHMTGTSTWGNKTFVYQNDKNKNFTISANFTDTTSHSVKLIVLGTNVLTYSSSDLNEIASSETVSLIPNVCSKLSATFNSGNYDYIVYRFSNNYSNTTLSPASDLTIDEIQLEAGTEVTSFEPYTNGASPNPDYPQEVKTVKGYNNYLENDLTSQTINDVQFVTENDKSITINGTASSAISLNIKNPFSLKAGTYTLFLNKNKEMSSGNWYIDIRKVGTSISIMDGSLNFSNDKKTFTITEDMDNLRAFIYIGSGRELNNLNLKLLLIKGTEEHPYVPYGNNYVNVAVSDGTNTNNYSIPLNGNEIAGIGNYLDELIVDKEGHLYINKKIGKVVLNGTETISKGTDSTYTRYQVKNILPLMKQESGRQEILSNYYYYAETGRAVGIGFAYWTDGGSIFLYPDQSITTAADFKDWLSTHNTVVYYVRETPQPIDLNTTIDLHLFKGINNITNSEDANMKIRYVKSIDDILASKQDVLVSGTNIKTINNQSLLGSGNISVGGGGGGGTDDYDELSNRPQINSTTLTGNKSLADLGIQSEISSTNKIDAGFVDDSLSTNKFVTSAEKTTWNNKSDFSGDYNDLTNKPTIPTVPTNVSSFTNDANYQNATQVQTAINNAIGNINTVLATLTTPSGNGGN